MTVETKTREERRAEAEEGLRAVRIQLSVLAHVGIPGAVGMMEALEAIEATFGQRVGFVRRTWLTIRALLAMLWLCLMFLMFLITYPFLR